MKSLARSSHLQISTDEELEDSGMLTKKNRTIYEYKKAGAEMRLLKSLMGRTIVDASCVLTAADQDKLMRALDCIDEVCSHAEDNMFHDFPTLSNDHIDVFYGDVNDKPRNSVDEEQISLAKQVADGLFGREDN